MLQLSPVTPEHAQRAADFIHPEREKWCALEPAAEVARSVSDSLRSWAVLDDGELLGIVGVRRGATIVDGVEAWIYSLPAARARRVALMRAMKHWLDDLLRAYGRVYGYVDARFTESVRMCQWLGMRLDGPHEVPGIPAPYYFVEAPNG